MKRATATLHEFAVYYKELSKDLALMRGPFLILKDADLIHRITRVLRLSVDSRCILFDRDMHVRTVVSAITPKELTLELSERIINPIIKPYIRFLLPLLKKEDMEIAIYSLAELGINEIQIVTTAKVQRAWSGKKEYERLERIIIAAAEQSKCYHYPLLKEPISFKQSLELFASHKDPFFFFDPTGQQALTTIQYYAKTLFPSCTLMIGPEGDLTHQEKQDLTNNKIQFCALTPTILRACQAAAIGAGLFRSVFK